MRNIEKAKITNKFSFSFVDGLHTAASAAIVLSICLALPCEASFRSNATSSAKSPIPSASSTAKSARGEYHHYDSYYPPHFYGHGGGGGHYKDLDHYLVPILVLLGLGVLLMPMISVLMTGLVGNVPVTTLVSGRKRRDAGFPTTDKIIDLIGKVEKAFELFSKVE